MASVDERIVRMEFDNAAFEKKVDSTIAQLGQLDKALKFDGAKQGLADVGSAVDKFHLNGMGTAIDGISAKFLALSTIGITVLSTITSKAISAGAQIVKSLSLDQVIAGFQEYELNIGSIQTILANTKKDGTNLQQVNAALDELNTYSDKTIYNFGQMTKNIGTFTAAGVDLNTSVASIKGISNLAAISGSSADQASTAMYQLSQAVASGTLKLQDWNSVVNAGMGGKTFQEALFNTGKAMKTISGVPMGETFDQWTASGHTFRDSLKDGWVTADVLTNTLKGFTGEMTDAQLAAIGYSKEQIAQIQELGRTGVDAATKVRTLTQLISTTKEAIGSGWSESFRIVIGNFEEATTLFTGISDAIGKVISDSAKARNELLQGWKDLGGRTLLIDAVTNVIKNLLAIVKPIKDAFQDIFPPLTAQRLMDLTKGFANFADMLKPSGKTIDEIKRIFEGLFAILKIGWDVLKNGVKFIADLVVSLTGLGGGAILAGLAKVGDFFSSFQKNIANSKNIQEFFQNITEHMHDAVQAIGELKDKLADFFKGAGSASLDTVGAGVDNLGQRFSGLKTVFDKIGDVWPSFEKGLMKVTEVLGRVWDAISNWFKTLGQKIAAVIAPGDYKATLDALNTALLGGIAGLLAKFIKDGFSFDVGKGVFDKIGKSFEELTGVLHAMQTSIKADVLLKIAGAIAVLTASVVVLSMINSADLTKALSAMAVGFGELMASFAVMQKMGDGVKSAAELDLLAGGMIAMSTAVLILAGAVKILSDLKWEELAKGLAAVTVLLGIMTGVALILSGNSTSLIAAGIGMVAIATAITILAGAVKIFATMSWTDIGKGLGSVAAGLLIIAGAMQLMPNGVSMALQGVGLVLIAVSLNILAGAVKIFATMSWTEIGKGLASIAGGLLIIAGAMQLMPTNMPITGVGLLLVSASLVVIAEAMKKMGDLSWKEIGKGLTGMAAALLILAIATSAMSDTIGGSIAIGIAAASLMILFGVVKAFSTLKWGDLLHGLGAMALALAAIAIAALLLEPAIPAMLALGAALTLIGLGFALFGAGAMLVAKAFELLAKAGEAGSKALVKGLENIGKALPAFFVGLAQGLVDFAMVFVKFAPVLVKALVVILGYLLDGLTELIPKVVKIIGELISGIIDLITTKYPEFVLAGIHMIESILKGIRDNVDKIVTLASEIIQNFLDALSRELPKIVDKVANLIITFFTSVAEATGRVAGTLMFGIGAAFIQGFVDGLLGNESGPMKWFTDLAGKVIGWIGDVATTLWDKGTDFISGLLGGIGSAASKVVSWFGGLAGNVLSWIGNVATTLWNKGVNFIEGLLGGIGAKAAELVGWFGRLAGSVVSWIGDTASKLYDKGWGFIQGLINGITNNFTNLVSWLIDLPRKVVGAIGDVGGLLLNAGRSILGSLLDGMKQAWNDAASFLSSLPGKIVNLKGPPKEDAVLLVNNGVLIMQGLQAGMEDEWDNVAKWLSEVDPAAEMDQNMGDKMTSRH